MQADPVASAERDGVSRSSSASLANRVIAARLHGWQRAIRRAPIQLPLRSPYFSIACSV